MLCLLTACTASSHATSSALAELQKQAAQLQSTSQQAHTHLARMSNTLKLMADTTATASDVDVAVRQLRSTMLEVDERAAQKVQRVCSDLQANLSKEVAYVRIVSAVGFEVDQLRLTAEEMACEVRKLEEQICREDGHAYIRAVRSAAMNCACAVIL